MNMRAEGSSVQFSIAAVERDTGLGKDTLRVWERRYGFPKPTRDAYDERTYPLDQVEKLRVIKRLLNAGLRPGKIVPLELSELLALSAQQNTPSQNIQTHDAHQNLLTYMDLLRQHAPEDLRNSLSQALVHMGLAAFINQVVAPLTQMVGESWMRGELAVFEEHLFTECITGVLRGVLNDLIDTRPHGTPTVLLTTFAQEPHGLGLLMAECMFALHGARCVSLGTQMPLQDIAHAVLAHQAHIVALSFSANMNPKQVLSGLMELRQLLTPQVQIWAGGRNPVLQRREQSHALVLNDLDHIGGALEQWRQAH